MGKQYNRKYEIDLPYEIRRVYSCAKAQAKFHKQEWAFSIETWWKFWEESGLWEHRGTKIHQFSMVRLDPIEAWGPHNCIIVSRRMLLKKNGYEAFSQSVPKTNWEPKHDARNKV